MNISERERKLRQSEMDYSLKANLYLHGVAFTPCEDCPFKDERLPGIIKIGPMRTRMEMCFERCPYEIMIWLLSKEQFQLYEKLRPLEKKKKDFQKAIRENKIVQIEIKTGEG